MNSYERPQRGRYRQFEQFGVERFDRINCPSSSATDAANDHASVARDADVIGVAAHFLHEVGVLDAVELQVNCLGDTVTRQNFSSALAEFLRPKSAQLSSLSQDRLARVCVRVRARARVCVCTRQCVCYSTCPAIPPLLLRYY